MGLLQNGYRHNLTGRLAGATNLDGWNPYAGVYNNHRTAASRNQFAGPAITDDLAAVPAGNRHPSAWIMPRKAGGLASHNEARGEGAATLAMASGINIAGLVGHSAVRFYVMGERAVEEQATPEELRRMTEVVAKSIDQ